MLRFSLPDSPPPPAVGESCLHRQFQRAACEACIKACPVGAITLTEHDISLAPEACLRCGNCVFVCPTGALVNISPAKRAFREQRLIAPFTRLAPELNELLLWHVQFHIRGVEIELDAYPQWGMAIAALNVQLRELQEPRWQIFPPAEEEHSAMRRLRGKGDRTCVDAALLPSAFPGFSRFTPRVDSERCLLCAACSRVCSPDVIAFSSSVMTVNAEGCNGCGACQAVCPVDAIAVMPETRQAERVVHSFVQTHCTDCARPFLSWNDVQSPCPVCRQHHHGMR